ncbi:TonB-dependent receptor plug domain-containing protein [Stutzerimonas tarimensis]|uniref:TonB-dependent receptor plug domain-containing protein n=1 Tax=Stutzerimonas tarimensis TaxID=1507735 RepID=A0ABV7TBA6_9GAMM
MVLLQGALIGAAPAAWAAEGDLFLNNQPVPEVLTATRLRQAPAAVPGSISVVDRALIRASGARELPELLRLVPGMLVVPNGNISTVNYHGSSARQARRLQVLVDGRSVYRAGFAQVDWHDIPVAIEDIERIEVFRGPNTVSYGANALMAVVNIITVPPAESEGTRLKYGAGGRGISDWYASQALHWDGGDLRLSLSGRQEEGFYQRGDGTDQRDGRRLNRFHLSADHSLGAWQTLEGHLALKEGSSQMNNTYQSILPIAPQPSESDADSDVTARDFAASLRWSLEPSSRHSLQVQANLQQWERLRSWRACDAQIIFSPELRELWSLASQPQRDAFLASGIFTPQTPRQRELYLDGVIPQLISLTDPATGLQAHTCGVINEDIRENRVDIEAQSTLSLNDDLRLVSGASYRYDAAYSETHLNDRQNRDVWRLFGHLEWYLSERWLLQAGAMGEYDSNVGRSLSPRVAVNYLITPAHGLRAVYTEAVRSPDMFENDADWNYRVTDLRPAALGQRDAYYFMSARGPGDLRQERIHSHELGYNGRFQRLGLNLDVKLFHDEISDLISHEPKIYRFDPDNRSRLILEGVETEIDWQLGLSDRLRLGYAYIQADASHPLDQVITPRHSGSLAWLRDWGGNWNSSLIYYGADGLNGYRFERMDLRLAKRVRMGTAELELAGVLQQRLDDEPLSGADNHYEHRHLFYLTVDLSF